MNNKTVSVSDIYCQERRILFIAGNRTVSANLSRHGEISSTSVLETPKKYKLEEK